MSLVSSKTLETNRAELTVEVKGEKFTEAVENAFRKNMKKITIPGFRKGKAPRAMVEKLYGKGMFLEEAMNELYPAAYTEAVDEAGITPVDAASIEVLSVDESGFSFKATVTTRPVAKVGNYKGLSAEKTEAQVAGEQLDEEIEKLREKYARVIKVEGRAAKLGDIADIDFEGFLDGVAFEGGKGEKYPLTLGSGSFIPGFEDQVVGHNCDEEFDVNVTFPEEYGEKSLAGKPAVFKVKINELKERQLPDIDDEFAKDISEFDTMQAYKEDLKSKMLSSAQAQSDAEFENKLIEQVVAGMQVEIPDCMIESRVDELVQDFGYRMSQQGLNLKDFIRYTGDTEEKFRETFRSQAQMQVKTRLALEAIAAAEKLEPSAEELEDEYKKLSEQYRTEVEKLRGIIKEKDLSEDISCRKAIELVVSNATAKAVTASDNKDDAAKEKPKTAKKPAAKKADAGEEKPKAAKKPAAKKADAGEEKPKTAKKTAAKKTEE